MLYVDIYIGAWVGGGMRMLLWSSCSKLSLALVGEEREEEVVVLCNKTR